MQSDKRVARGLAAVRALAWLAVMHLLPAAWPLPAVAASQFTLLHSFAPGEGRAPSGGVTLDQNGALYGVTDAGGASDVGTVFRLGQSGGKLKTLHSFTTADGALPQGTLIMDQDGALYGTTALGGTANRGTVFKLLPPAPGKNRWTHKLLHTFTDEGRNPHAGVVMDQNGALYGTTEFGGALGAGTVFQLNPPAPGRRQWKLKVLHSFSFLGSDGQQPGGSLILDQDGVLYGTTELGGASNRGTVFQLTQPAPGKRRWQHKVLHSFALVEGVLIEGASPRGGVVMGGNGTLYGTTSGGGANDKGTVFQVSPPLPGMRRWKHKMLHSFSDFDGALPFAGLVMDAAGVLFGTTSAGGTGAGTVFRIIPPARGKRAARHKVLHSFAPPDGSTPLAGLGIGQDGALYGTTQHGGSSSMGTVFKVLP